jgi:hypothetical protein
MVMVVLVVVFVSQVYIAPAYTHMFLTLSTNYDMWLNAGEIEFTHATQWCSGAVRGVVAAPTVHARG